MTIARSSKRSVYVISALLTNVPISIKSPAIIRIRVLASGFYLFDESALLQRPQDSNFGPSHSSGQSEGMVADQMMPHGRTNTLENRAFPTILTERTHQNSMMSNKSGNTRNS